MVNDKNNQLLANIFKCYDNAKSNTHFQGKI